ncbi:MAG: isocitrate/isopropylmalate dehydrogenase family protein [Salinivirgaceae bacterium]
MHTITLIKGDGIGPEITAATLKVIEASGVDIKWEEVIAGLEAIQEFSNPLPEAVIASLRKNGVGLKGPLTTPIGSGFRSVNVALRMELDLFANLRPSKSIPGVASPYKDIDLVVVRENTEGLYSGVEHMVGKDAAESIKIITRRASERIVRFAFEYAQDNKRRKVTAVHKANILKLSDGLFLETARQVAGQFPQIEFEDRIVDNMAMQLVLNPHLYDVMVMPNLYGDILSDLCAGLVGGLGLVPGVNIGETVILFEPVHGSVPEYAGKNWANPTAMILSAVLMLDHIGEKEAARRIENALAEQIKAGRDVIADLGGTAGTKEMAAALAERIKAS